MVRVRADIGPAGERWLDDLACVLGVTVAQAATVAIAAAHAMTLTTEGLERLARIADVEVGEND
jgi:hypothetical protein